MQAPQSRIRRSFTGTKCVSCHSKHSIHKPGSVAREGHLPPKAGVWPIQTHPADHVQVLAPRQDDRRACLSDHCPGEHVPDVCLDFFVLIDTHHPNAIQQAIIHEHEDKLGIKTIVTGIEANDKNSKDEPDSDDEEDHEPDDNEAYNEQQGSKKGKKTKGKASGKGKSTRRTAFWVVVTLKLRELLNKYGSEYKAGKKWKESLLYSRLFRLFLWILIC